MEQLLSHNPQQRHGGSFGILKSHPWFEDFNWNDLLMKNDKKLQPPYVPEVSLRSVKETAAKATDLFVNNIREMDNKSQQMESLDDSRDSFSWGSFGEVIDLIEDS